MDNITQWWKCYGKKTYPKSGKILILVDSGGANGYRSSMWKLKLNELLCDKYGIEATVCHYPAGASKWNPIEHRLFSEISNEDFKAIEIRPHNTIPKWNYTLIPNDISTS